MLKRNITYENPFTNQQVTEEHFFHISKADLVEMEMEEHGTTYDKDGETLTGMQAKLQHIVDSEDGRAIMREFKEIILRSYGKKEGERFLKSKEIADDFAASEAFSQLLFELCTQADAAAEFINGVVPHNLDQIADEVRAQAAKVTAGREAQEKAKAAGSSQLSEGTAAVMDGLTAEAPRIQELENATPENPVTLTQVEVREIDSDDLKSGLATGRYKLS